MFELVKVLVIQFGITQTWLYFFRKTSVNSWLWNSCLFEFNLTIIKTTFCNNSFTYQWLILLRYFHQKILQEKIVIFKKATSLGPACFLHLENQVFAYYAYTVFSFLDYHEWKKACLDNLCTNRTSLDRESLHHISWTSTAQNFAKPECKFLQLTLLFIKV